jgi:hypothetical protein
MTCIAEASDDDGNGRRTDGPECKRPGGPDTMCRDRRARRDANQFFDWSTSLFFVIHGIMPRSWAPTFSIS